MGPFGSFTNRDTWRSRASESEPTNRTDADDLPDDLVAEGSLEKHADRWAARGGTEGRIDPTWDRPTTFERLRTEVPGALTWSERHRGLYAAVIMIPISGFALLLTLAMHRVN